MGPHRRLPHSASKTAFSSRRWFFRGSSTSEHCRRCRKLQRAWQECGWQVRSEGGGILLPTPTLAPAEEVPGGVSQQHKSLTTGVRPPSWKERETTAKSGALQSLRPSIIILQSPSLGFPPLSTELQHLQHVGFGLLDRHPAVLSVVQWLQFVCPPLSITVHWVIALGPVDLSGHVRVNAGQSLDRASSEEALS